MPSTRDTGASSAKVYNRAQCTAYIKKHLHKDGEVRGAEQHTCFRVEAWSGNQLLAVADDINAPRAWTRLMGLLVQRVARNGGRSNDP